ncbi:MAG: D-alanine--D-alanine ligase [Bacteroidales bacterium]|nr:D-alanine--D-alanine ligase [Bacteroidales bacterium]MBQ1938105.1 D-alanine--D-alanine ligase [Bacteroidales bacterium]
MKITVGLLFGGRSVENEISVVTALQTLESMDKNRYEIVPIYIAKSGKWYSGEKLLTVSNYKDMKSLLAQTPQVYMRPIYGDHNLYLVKKSLFGKDVLAKLDVVLPTLHGTNCEDGTLQGVLTSTGVPFVGCNTLASANGMDKITMKMILKECGIPVVDYFWFNDKEWYADRDAVIVRLENRLAYPVIVKPANSGSSVGIKAAHNREELIEAVDEAASFTTRVIVERLVTRLKEVNCSVMGDYNDCETSVCEVPMRSGEILSYQDKYMRGGGGKNAGTKGAKMGGTKGGGLSGESEGMRSTLREIPAKLQEGETERIQALAKETFKALSCDGLSRIDFIIDEEDRNIYVNEINTIPGSLSSYLWEYSGKKFPEVIDRLIELAFARSREESFKITDFGGNIFAAMPSGGAKISK